MRWTTLVVVAALVAGCSDLRDFRGEWKGERVGTAEVVKVGAPQATRATLVIDDIDAHGLSGTISLQGIVTDASVTTVPAQKPMRSRAFGSRARRWRVLSSWDSEGV